MSKINLADLSTITGNETSAINTINNNSTLIETFSDNTLSRDGTTPNHMLDDLDMNSHSILNLPVPTTAAEPLRLQDLSDFIGGGSIVAGAPTNASYVTLGTNATLSNERVLTAGTNISLVDGGAGNTLTINVTGGGPVTGPGSSTDNSVVRWDGTGGNLLQNTSGVTISDAFTLAISPTAASTNKAITIAQSAPISGSGVAEVSLNDIVVNGEALALSSNNVLNALKVSYGFGGSNATGQRTAITGLLVMNSATSASNPLANAYAAVTGQGQMSTGAGGTNTGAGALGTMMGMYGSVIASAGATNLHRMTGQEINSGIRTTASTRYHFGTQITQWADHAVSAAEIDAGIYLANQSGAIGWKHYGLVFDSSGAGTGTMFTTNATIIGTKGSMSVTNGVDISSATISNNAWASPNNVVITGGGRLGVGTTSPGFKGHFAEASAGIIGTLVIEHTDNTTGTSDARIIAKVGGSSGGDPYILYTGASGTSSWASGFDNSDSDTFKISNNATLGTNDFLTITTAGLVSGTGTIRAQSATAVPAGGTTGAGFSLSSTTNLGIYFGSGVPTLSAAQGSLYLRTDGAINARLYINTNGSTTWTAFNTTA